ncbi:hypothetical protein [Acinetobacter guerrae]|uniref:hypothetical protein n=1 Tax=Acinetobacter guerrae TaxID=1843371 RepID=UPI00148E344C|nr:hypothetical protein [Acinetobacter guerrae]
MREFQLIAKQIYLEVLPRVEYKIIEFWQNLPRSIDVLGAWMTFSFMRKKDEK